MHVLSLLSYSTTFIRILRQDLMLSDKFNISIHSSKFNFVTAAKYSLTWSIFQIFTSFASRCPKIAYACPFLFITLKLHCPTFFQNYGVLQFTTQKQTSLLICVDLRVRLTKVILFTLNQALAISLHINTVLNVWNNICSPFAEHAHFSLGCLSFSRIGQTVQPPFVKPLHEIADFFIAPVLKDNQPLYSESFLVLFSSARSISGKQLVSLSLSLFNYSLKGYYYYNYVLWLFDQQGLIGYFFRRNVWCNKTHHCQPLLCKPTFSSLANAEEKHFFSKLVFHFYY